MIYRADLFQGGLIENRFVGVLSAEGMRQMELSELLFLTSIINGNLTMRTTTPIQIRSLRYPDRIRIKVIHKINPSVNGWVDLLNSGTMLMIPPEAGAGETRAFNAVYRALEMIKHNPSPFIPS